MHVSVIICTKNEEKYISQTIKRIKKIGNYEIIVVDKSNDDTPVIARNLGAKVIKQRSDGKGNAMRLGAKKARSDVIVFVDGDNSYEVEKIPEMLNLLKKCKIVYGWRKFRRQKLVRFIGDKLVNLLIRILKGYSTKDLLTGFFAIRKKDFLALGTDEKGFGIETEIFIKVNNLGWKICHVWVDYFNRKDSKLNFRSVIRILHLIVW